jgi:Ion channel
MARMLEAISLSLNVFSTLGFGNLPTLGISRYLAIIEGFIGWFLLSIFSVALISQVIQ